MASFETREITFVNGGILSTFFSLVIVIVADIFNGHLCYYKKQSICNYAYGHTHMWIFRLGNTGRM